MHHSEAQKAKVVFKHQFFEGRLHLAACKRSECVDVAKCEPLMHKVVCKLLHIHVEKKREEKIQVDSRVGDDASVDMQYNAGGGSLSSAAVRVEEVEVGGGGGLSLAALQQLGQRVPQLGQLEDLAVQQLEQGAEALTEGLPLQLAALQALLHVAQLGLQRLVPRLRVL